MLGGNSVVTDNPAASLVAAPAALRITQRNSAPLSASAAAAKCNVSFVAPAIVVNAPSPTPCRCHSYVSVPVPYAATVKSAAKPTDASVACGGAATRGAATPVYEMR